MIKSHDFSHIQNNFPTMVDVSNKKVTSRMAQAETKITLPQELANLIQKEELRVKKGPVFSTAIISGVLAAKKTSELIPFCHQIALKDIQIKINLVSQNILKIICTAKTCDQTGVELEALVGASIAALTIYDMCKSVSSKIIISDTRVIKKTGGRHDVTWVNSDGRQESPHGSR